MSMHAYEMPMSGPPWGCPAKAKPSDGARIRGGGRGDRLPFVFALLGSEQLFADNGSVKATLEAINKMQAAGVIGQSPSEEQLALRCTWNLRQRSTLMYS